MPAFVLNITFDALDPQRLGRFWADALGYHVAVDDPDFVRLSAPDSRGIRHVLFFRVDRPTPGKNRMHVDLASRDPVAAIGAMVEAGATLVDGGTAADPIWRSGNGTQWVVMSDPEGNEFCIG